MPVLASEFPVYQPSMRIITAITNGFPAIVTTSFDHQYGDGIVLRLIIPKGFGMVQADHKFGTISVLSPTTFSIDIDTTFFDAFSAPTTYPLDSQYAQSVPFGEENDFTVKRALRNVLPYSAV